MAKLSWRETLVLAATVLFSGMAGPRPAAAVTVNLMAVYSSAARAAFSDIDARIDLAVADANQFFRNSLVDIQVVAVSKGVANFTEETTLVSTVNRLRNPSDGFLDDIFALRQSRQADIICIIPLSAQDAGWAQIMHTPHAGFRHQAFFAVRADLLTNTKLFAHEMTHTMGLNHDRGNNFGTGAYSYSFANNFRGNDGVIYGTICSEAPTLAPLFSNPNVAFQGQPTGVPEGQPNSSDCARSLNNVAGLVSQFRQPPPPAPANDAFANRALLSGVTVTVSANNESATREPGEPAHDPSGTDRSSLWWTWTAPSTGPVVLDTFGSDFDTVLAVYTGSSLGGLTRVASNNDSPGGPFFSQSASRVTFTATAGTTCQIAVAGLDFDVGNISLHLVSDQAVTTLPPGGSTLSAVQLDGVNDYLEVPDAPAVRLTGAMTIEAWVKRAATGVQHSIAEKYGCPGAAPSVGGYAFRIGANDKLGFWTLDDCSTGASAVGGTSLQANTWYHVAAVFDGGAIRLYVNGVPDGMASTTHNPRPGNTPLRLGARGNDLGTPFAGVLDEVRLWNVARTASDITANMNLCLGGNQPGLTAYWPIEEGSGATTVDVTGNGNNATLANGPVWTRAGAPLNCNTPLPIVSIVANDPLAAEPDDPGQFTVSRTGSSTNSLTVTFSVGGTASSGVDYPALGTSVTIPAGASSATLTVRPVDDTMDESNETVVVTLSTNSAYVIDLPGNATVTIADRVPIAITGTALRFDGLNDVVEVPDSPTVRLPGPLTIEAWIKRSAAGVQQCIAEKYGCPGAAPSVGGYAFRIGANDKLVFWTLDHCSGGANVTGATSLQANTWYHVAGVFDGGALRVYVNGVLDGVTPTTHGAQPGNTPLRLGARGNDRGTPFAGVLDEVRMWNLARSATDLVANINRCLTGAEPGLAALWRFEEGGGLSALDSTGRGGNGALLNGPAWVISDAPLNCIALPPPLPVVSIVATDATAGEPGDPGQFIFTRTGSTNSALIVNFAVTGTALPGLDYAALGTSVTIPAGTLTALLAVAPIDDTIVESVESIVVSLLANGAYAVSATNNTATVTVADNDGPSLVIASALRFDGVNDYVNVPDSAGLRLTGPMTIEAWIQRAATGVQHCIAEKYGCPGVASSVGGYAFRVTANDRLVLWTLDDCNRGVAAVGGTSLQADTWYHVAGVFDGAAIRLYVNGALDGLTVTTRGAQPGNTPLRLGARGNDLGTPFAGVLDEVRMWNVARTPVELQASRATRLNGTEPGLAAYWRFDEGSGLTTADATSAGHTATLLNGPMWTTTGAPLIATLAALMQIPPPPVLSISLGSSGDRIEVRASGAAGQTCRLEASGDLRVWIELETFVSDGAAYRFQDTAAADAPARFYRVRTVR